MEPTINMPYVKEFDENGQLLNPIKGMFKTQGLNRKMRREKNTRFMNNKKSFPITILKTRKFIRKIQTIIFYNESEGVYETRKILHHLDK